MGRSHPIGQWFNGWPFLWGENNNIRLSLDRGDLWDERTAGGKDWWKAHSYHKAADLIAKKEYEFGVE